MFSRKARTGVVFIGAGLVLGATATARAQTAAPDSALVQQAGTPRPSVTSVASATSASSASTKAAGFFAPAFSRGDLHLVEGFAVAGAIAFPLDEWINRNAQSAVLHGSGTANVSRSVDQLALPGAYYAMWGLYGTGVLIGREGLADAGWHGLASVVIASNLGLVIEAELGRARPNASSDAERFAFGAPLRSAHRYSLPSGHTTVAFAAASALSEELSQSEPEAARIIDPVLYGAAGLVGAARIYERVHWTSDVVAGAALGTFTSRVLVRAAHAHRRNLVDRAMVHGLVTMDNAGRTLIGFTSGQ